MKIDSIDTTSSFEVENSPLEKQEKFVLFNYPARRKRPTTSLSEPIQTPYKPVSNIKTAKKAYDYYLNRGLQPNVAAGIVGNLYKESGLNTNALGDKGTAYGIAQWRGSRLNNLKQYAAKRGTSYSDFNTQLDYVLDEQGENSVLGLMQNQSPEQAAKTFADKYERPNPKYADYGTRQSVARQLTQMRYGGNLKKKALGGTELVGLVQQGMNLGAGVIDSFNDQENPNTNLSALSGFIKGNAALPGVGGILGAISSIKGAKKQQELFKKKQDMENRETMDYFNIRSKGVLGNYPTKGSQGSFYAKGGGIDNPQYEVEHGEVVVGDDVQLTGGKQIASNLHKVVGKTHDQSNPNTVNGTGEDGSGGEFVFSDRIGIGNKTFAQLATQLANQKAKYEKDMNHNDYIFKNTANANIEITDAKLQQLAQIQEAMKGNQTSYGYYKYGGGIPKYGPGGDLTAEQAYEQAYKNLEKAAKARAGKAANKAAKAAADAAYEAAYNTERKVAEKVGKEIVGKTATRLGGSTAMRILGTAGRAAGAASAYGTAIGATVAGMQDAKKRGGFYSSYGYYAGMNKPSGLLSLDKDKQNFEKQQANSKNIIERRAGRNKPVGTVTNVPKPTPKVIKNVSDPINVTDANLPTGTGGRQQTFTGTIDPYSTIIPEEKPDFSYTVQGTENMSPIKNPKTKGTGEGIDPSLIASGLMSAASYAANNNMINKYKTRVSANMLQNPNYNYYDRSGLARQSVRGATNSILNNPFLNQGSKQAAFANSLNVANQIEQEEANRKMEYDNQYRAQTLDTENRNNMILNQARQQTMANENQKLGMKQENTNQLFQNINTGISEFNANRMQNKAMKYYSLPLMKRLGLSDEEQQTFLKDPSSFLMGESGVAKKKMGGKLKSKYC